MAAGAAELPKNDGGCEYMMQIYLIEEEELLAKIHSDFLKDLGYKVIKFKTVSEMSEALKDAPRPDVIVLNSFTSRNECIRGIGEIHKIFPETKIILISDLLTPGEATSYGAYSHDQRMDLSGLEEALIKIKQDSRS